jgi:hypothetical protein
MSPEHISTAKGAILRATKKRPKGAKKAAAGAEPAAAPVRKAAIPLDDILHIKALVGRLGPEQLHKLIDAFAK